MKKVGVILLFLNSGIFVFNSYAQSILDSCYTSASASVTFTSSATLSDAADADLLEWNGSVWNGAGYE